MLSIDAEAVDLSKEKPLILKALKDALRKVILMRQAEGSNLQKDIVKRMKSLRQLANAIKQRSKITPKEKAKKLKDRLKELLGSGNLNEQQISQEIAIMADRIDITEELVRLESHLKQFESTLGQFPQGRKLDFVLQELFREWNTIGSKAQDSQIQKVVVEAKVELERLREQVQNVE